MNRIIAFFMSAVAFFCSVFGIPFYAVGDTVDMSKFVLTFEENFDTELDRSVWSGHYVYGNQSVLRKGGYWNNDMAHTENGNLIIPLKYLEEGMGGKGAGWYTAGIDTDSDAPNGFSQKYGYFECRCILPECADAWSAFWLMNEGVYNVDGNGMDGTEIDVFESMCYKDKFHKNAIETNLHIDGYGEDHKKMGAVKTLVKGDPYKEFNTYAVEWNENEYIFYINSVEAFRTSWGGVSQNPEYMILSVEYSGDNGVPSNVGDKVKEYQFIVDYVRAYQYKELV